MQTLFENEDLQVKNKIDVSLTCNSCENRQRHQCNSKVFQYCGIRKSNRTNNGLLKIKCKTIACNLYQTIKPTPC